MSTNSLWYEKRDEISPYGKRDKQRACAYVPKGTCKLNNQSNCTFIIKKAISGHAIFSSALLLGGQGSNDFPLCEKITSEPAKIVIIRLYT